MKKHKFNIFPEAKPEDYDEIRDDIAKNGFDSKRPVTIYQGEILDGWNRQKACDELGITPAYSTFTGTEMDALEFVLSTNRRRNLNSGQRATVAAEADELMVAIAAEVEEERKRKIAEAMKGNLNAGQRAVIAAEDMEPEQMQQIIVTSEKRDPNKNATTTKTAELFNTNRTYVNQAVKMRKEAPEIFEKVKAGKMTMQDARKEVARKPEGDEWLPDELERKARVEKGESVTANFQRDKHLIQWASENGKMLAIDRSSKWGNPFIMGPDGDRDTVCDCFEKYAVLKRSFETNAQELKGKVLCCHCYPERCHGETLIHVFANQP
jgi:hypothetical protein